MALGWRALVHPLWQIPVSYTHLKGEKDDDKKEEKKPVDPATKRRRIVIGIVVGVVVLVAVVAWWLYSRTYESTDDAQINGHLNAIASRVAGTVKRCV